MSITRRNRHAAVAATVATAAASWAVVTQVAGVHLGVHLPGASPTTVALGPAIGAAATTTVLGWGVLALLETRVSRPRRTWVALALAVLLVSLALPVAFAATTAAAAGLVAIHLAVGAVAITGLARTATEQRAEGSSAFASVKLHRPSHTVLAAGFAALAMSTALVGGITDWAGRAGSAHTMSARTEHFHVLSTKPSGPGTIIVTGVINAGGTENPGRAIDSATFADGTFRIDHSSGRPTVGFDPATCVGTITQAGPFKVIDATGDMASLDGSGRYTFRALYTTARVAGHCSSAMTAYTETIDGVVTVGDGA